MQSHAIPTIECSHCLPEAVKLPEYTIHRYGREGTIDESCRSVLLSMDLSAGTTVGNIPSQSPRKMIKQTSDEISGLEMLLPVFALTKFVAKRVS